MSFPFDSAKLKAGLSNFQAKAADFGAKVSAQTAQMSEKAAAGAQKFGTAAQAAARDAAAGAKSAASQAQQGAKRLAGSGMIGQEVVIGGKALLVDSLLAEGGFGSVYTAIPLPQAPNSEKFVLKKMYAGSPDLAKQLTSEVKLMEKLSHPNIVKVLGSSTQRVETRSEGSGLEILVLMEMCPGGHLLTRLNQLKEQKRSLPFTKVLEVLLQIARPIAYMHSLSPAVTHRDLKFENILVAADGTLRLCDFGSSSTHSGPITDKHDRAEQEDAILRYTTPHFRAPEMCDLFNNQPLDARTDVWALGCMLYGLCYLGHPFQDGGNLAILSARYKLPTQPAYPAPIHTMIRACLQYCPGDRPTAAQLVLYAEACFRAGEAGPFPDLHLSGGGSVPTLAVPAPTPGSEGALPDGSVMITGVSSERARSASTSTGADGQPDGGSAGIRKVATRHAPTAQDILLQVQSQTLANAAATSSKSSALQARLRGKGGAPGPIQAPLQAPTAAAVSHLVTPAAAAASNDSFSADFDAFNTAAQAPHRTPTAAAPASNELDMDFFSSGGGGGSSSATSANDDFGFDFDTPATGAASGSSSHSSAARARAPSGGNDDGADARPPSGGAASPAAASDDFFSSGPAAQPVPAAATGLEDPFSTFNVGSGKASTPKPASTLDDFFSM